MTRVYSPQVRRLIDNSIHVLCPLVQATLDETKRVVWTEFELRRELVACLLGSQVRYETARAACRNLESAGLLDDGWWANAKQQDFKSCVFDVLSAPAATLPYRTRYRFPKSRSQQLSRSRDALAYRPLLVRLSSRKGSRQMRQDLVADIPGLGPKQASMFLRNIGEADDLAILDTHVLNFIALQHLCSTDRLAVGTVKAYERTEQVFLDYARRSGYPLGCLDVAIWVTMKAAGELKL